MMPASSGEVVPFQPDEDPRERQRLAERYGAILAKMESEAERRVARRHHIEKQWIEDLEHYHGRYDSETAKRLDETKRSQLFVNMTGPKTDAMSARLIDLLFPTDDRNWGIHATPVPELSKQAEAAVDEARALNEQAGQQQDPAMAAQMQTQARAIEEYANKQRAILDEASDRAKAMEAEIQDCLVQSRSHIIHRDQIEDACRIGTGVVKGPIAGGRKRKGWQQGPEGYSLAIEDAPEQPAIYHTDIWNFFPDPDARTIEESEGVYERHLLTKKKMRDLASLPGFDKDAIREVMKEGPKGSAPSYLADLRNITGASQQITGETFHVWEFLGPVDGEDLVDLLRALGDDAMLDQVGEVDPLISVNICIWFCQGRVLKIAPYPMDSGEPLYSVYNLFKDEASIFGYGIPRRIRQAQQMLNGAARALMDNAGNGVSPMIVVDPQAVEPQDGVWEWRGSKIWLRRTAGGGSGASAFEQFAADMRIRELDAIITLALKFIDDLASLPMIAQGEQGSHTTKTQGGMTLLMNSANVVFRRFVKNFDDDVTVPLIRRMYDWHMQFSPKDEIKGDFEVDARGSSVLLVREVQAQNLMVLASNFTVHPAVGPLLKTRAIVERLLQANMMPAQEVMHSETEYDEIEARIAAAVEAALQQAQAEMGATGPDPAIKQAELELRREEMASKIEIANMEADTRRYIAEMQVEAGMMKLAEDMNMTLEDVRARLADRREERESRERKFAAEVAMTERHGPSGGGHF
jgi:hypothetical protein